jgi:hypothetical protein
MNTTFGSGKSGPRPVVVADEKGVMYGFRATEHALERKKKLDAQDPQLACEEDAGVLLVYPMNINVYMGYLIAYFKDCPAMQRYLREKPKSIDQKFLREVETQIKLTEIDAQLLSQAMEDDRSGKVAKWMKKQK